MTRYVALNDTVYRFRVIRKGNEIVGGEELDKNINFARVGAPAADAGKATAVSADEKEIRLRAKELKISNWHTKAKDKLLAEIAEAEAKLAAPVAAAAGETADETADVPADAPETGDVQANV